MDQRWNLGIDTSINHTFTQLDFTNSCQAPADHAQCLKMPIVYRRGLHPKECLYVKLYAKVDITKQKNLKLTEGKNRQFSKKVIQTPRH